MDNNSFFEVWAKESPETSKAFFEFAGTIGKFGGLDPKTHQLVYIGMQVCKGNVSSVCAHAGFAKALGATRQEIIGVIATVQVVVAGTTV